MLNKQITKKKRIYNYLKEIHSENNIYISINDEFSENYLSANKDNEDNFEEENIDHIDDIDELKIDEELSTKIKRIKKLHFFDFFLNNLYCCCKKQKQQKIIHTCNQLVYKYASIDDIIRKQILMENLLKDYKWNDPSLNNVENNELFIQLQTYL